LQLDLGRKRGINEQSWGTEAALNCILDAIQHDHLPDDEEISRFAATAGRRERNRAQLRLVHLDTCDLSPSPEDGFIARDGLAAVQAQVTAREWAFLTEVGEGRDYGEVAALMKVTPGSLRARICRLRKRLAKAA
jgi:DNA-directed RNA polymerase specialized sigma24 family protein